MGNWNGIWLGSSYILMSSLSWSRALYTGIYSLARTASAPDWEMDFVSSSWLA